MSKVAMSDMISAMPGADMMAASLSNDGRRPLNPLQDSAETSDFPSLFASISQPQEIAAEPMTDASMASGLLPGLPFAMFTLPVSNTGMPGLASETTMGGNGLPLMPQITQLSGFVAQADQNGATAVSFAGDGKQVFASTIQNAPAVLPALQATQQQLSEILRFPGLQPGADPLAAVSGLEQIKSFEKLINNNAELATPVHGTNPSMVHVSPLQGQGMDFNTVLHTQARPEPMTAHLQQPQWDNELGQRVHWMISQGIKQADIRLNPPELGALEVRIQLQGDQATVQFASPHSQVRDALDAALPRLREMLAETGLNLAGSNISNQSFSQNHAQSEQGQGNSQSDQRMGTDLLDGEGMVSGNSVQKTGKSLLDVFA